MTRMTSALLTVAAITAATGVVAYAQDAKPATNAEAAPHTEVLTISDPRAANFVEMKGTAFANASLRGDLSKEAGTFLSRTAPGGVASWHRHTPIEEFAVLVGNVVVQVKGHAPLALGPGGYSQVPAGAPHRFRCTSKEACILFTVGAGAYDMHWVDQDGHDITDEQAKTRPDEVGKTW